MKYKIIKRHLENLEIDKLILDTKSFPNLGYVNKKNWRKMPKLYVIEINNQFAGACVVHELKNWIKIGPLVVLSNYQNLGLGRILLTYIINKYSKLFIASSNPIVINIVKSHSFHEINSVFFLPLEIQLFLIKQLFEYLNLNFLFEVIRKKIMLKRGKIHLFIKN